MTGGNLFSGGVLGLFAAVVPSSQPAPFSALNPGTWEITHWIALGSFLVAVFSAYAVFRKDRKAEKSGALDAKMRLDEMIDKRMQANLQSAWDEIDNLKKDRDDLKRQVASLQGAEEENQQKTEVVKRFFIRLVRWDSEGRPGMLPLPPAEDVAIMGLEHPIEDTLTRQRLSQERDVERY